MLEYYFLVDLDEIPRLAVPSHSTHIQSVLG